MIENRLYKINPAPKPVEAKKKCAAVVRKPAVQFLILGAILCALQLLSLNGAVSPTFVSVLKRMMIYSMVAVGYCFLLGYAGLASLGTAGFFGVGIYIAYFLMGNSGLPLIVVLIVAIAVAIVLGIIVGFISLRIEGIYLAIITLGLAEVIRYVLKAVYSGVVQIKNRDLKLFGLSIGRDGMFFVICIMLVVLMIAIHNLITSPTGRAMVAMKSSTSASQAFGISLMKYRLLAFVIATLFATLGGVAYMIAGNAISPSSEAETTLKITMSLNILGAVIIGGYKSIWGSVFGVFLVFGLSDVFSIVLSNEAYNKLNPYISLIVGVLIIVVVMFFPGGLAQLMGELKVKIRKSARKMKESKYGKDI